MGIAGGLSPRRVAAGARAWAGRGKDPSERGIVELADRLFWLDSSQGSANVYLAGDVLIDVGTRGGASIVLRQLEGRAVKAVVLTHAHPPAAGAAHHVCSALDAPLWCGAADADAVERGDLSETQPRNWVNTLQRRLRCGPGHRVDRRLEDGDEVEEFRVIATPGHSPGHVALWRERDRVLVIGDVVTNENVFTRAPGLHLPPPVFTRDEARNRESARSLAGLRPSLVCFGHGRPLFETDGFETFVSSL
jgi:hydroxyacylglutathione hydrolase